MFDADSASDAYFDSLRIAKPEFSVARRVDPADIHALFIDADGNARITNPPTDADLLAAGVTELYRAFDADPTYHPTDDLERPDSTLIR